MRILISGSRGMVGSVLSQTLARLGHTIVRLVRSKPEMGQVNVMWDPAAGTVVLDEMDKCELVVHLAGESIASGRWTPAKKEAIRQSRIQGTRFLCESLTQLKKPPKVLVCASAIGFYGERGNDLLREDRGPGAGFLSKVCRDWEAATEAASKRGIRVVNLRFGIILSATGGALAKMLLPFRLGLGGRIGSGKQYMSWIALGDAVGSILHAAETDALSGPVNAVSPQPVTNAEFTKTLGRALRRPTLFPLPAFAARFALGEMADELLLASTRVEPAKLLKTGYRFQYPQLEGALHHLLTN